MQSAGARSASSLRRFRASRKFWGAIVHLELRNNFAPSGTTRQKGQTEAWPAFRGDQGTVIAVKARIRAGSSNVFLLRNCRQTSPPPLTAISAMSRSRRSGFSYPLAAMSAYRTSAPKAKRPAPESLSPHRSHRASAPRAAPPSLQTAAGRRGCTRAASAGRSGFIGRRSPRGRTPPPREPSRTHVQESRKRHRARSPRRFQEFGRRRA